VFGLFAKLLVGAAVVGGGTAVVYTATAAPSSDVGVVTKHVDGDTLDVRLDGGVERIRLLNVDTPETVDPDEDVQCLGPEASAFLAGLLPVGTEVSLRYDSERRDSYDRTLAAVYAGDVFVNAEIARAGLGVAKVFGDNDTYFPEVRAAQQEAERAGRGLYSPQVECTLPAKVAAAQAAAGAAPAASTAGSSGELESAAAQADRPIAAGAAFLAWAAGDRDALIWAAYDREAQDREVRKVTRVTDQARSDQTALRSAAGAAREREQAEVARIAEEKAAAERAAKEQAAREQAAREKAAADRAAASRASTPRAPSVPSAPSAPRTSAPSAGSSAQNPYPGYTGPRCYAPGGKTWRPC
jgi:micrococcal nuclease